VLQCVLFEGTGRDARLIGVDDAISERLFAAVLLAERDRQIGVASAEVRRRRADIRSRRSRRSRRVRTRGSGDGAPASRG
jgi:hypothetical protein